MSYFLALYFPYFDSPIIIKLFSLLFSFHFKINTKVNRSSIHFQMSLLDQNWGAGGSADDEAQDDNQQGRQVRIIYFINYEEKNIL